MEYLYIIINKCQSVKNSNAGYSKMYNIKSVERSGNFINALAKTKNK